MSSTKKGLRRVALAAVSTLVVIPAMAAIASATPTFAFNRLAGVNRYETSVEIAKVYGNSTSVILANGANKSFPDSLTAAYLAGEKDAPVLLTQRDTTPANVLARIAASGAKTVYLVGGEGVISAAQAVALDVAYTVVRLGGLDRYLTAQAVIADAGTAKSTTAVLATGVNFPDAIAGGPLSYVKGMPLAITLANRLPAATLAALKTAGTTNVIVLGGPTVVSQAVLDTLAANGITLNRRIAGANRSETSSLLAEYLITSQGFTKTGVNVASGYSMGGGADALAGGPLSGQEVRPTLITESVTNVGPGPIKYLKDNCSTLAAGHIFGGPAAVSVSAQAEMTAAGRCLTAGSNQTFTVSPVGNQNVEAGTVSQFTFSGITSSTVDIALVGCANVTTAAGGLTTFPNSSNPGGTGNVANLGGAAVTSDITVLNGVAVAEEQNANDVAVTNGSISFTVTNGAANDCYVAVVFSDADNDGFLDLGTNNQPTEAFAVAGDRNVIVIEAVDGTNTIGLVDFVDKAADLFSTATRTFYYDSGDEFRLEAGAVDTVLTMAQFEERISAGDSVAGIYRSSPANQSSFTLTDTAPLAPTGLATQAPSGTDTGKAGIEVVFNDSATATVASYNVFRATAIQPVITGGTVTCPTAASAYTQVGTVDDVVATTNRFFDGTAVAPTAGNPAYCYNVVSVDETGDTGPATGNVGPATATAAGGAPNFVGTSNSFSGVTVTVNYDEAIKPASTDTDASNYAVTVTRGGVTTALTEVSTTDAGSGLAVTITVSGIPGGIFQVGDTVVVTAKVGLDTNTVLDLTDVAQPVGDAVEVTTSADAVAPTATISATAAGAATSTVQFSEVVTGLTVADFTITGGPTATLAAVDGDTYTLTYATEAVVATDTVTLGANSVMDTAGNAGPPSPVLMTVS